MLQNKVRRSLTAALALALCTQCTTIPRRNFGSLNPEDTEAAQPKSSSDTQIAASGSLDTPGDSASTRASVTSPGAQPGLAPGAEIATPLGPDGEAPPQVSSSETLDPSVPPRTGGSVSGPPAQAFASDLAELISLQPRTKIALQRAFSDKKNCTAYADPGLGTCSLELECGNAASKTSCRDTGSGMWKCGCESSTRRVDYDLTTDQPALACAAGLGFCLQDAVLPAPVCSSDATALNAETCSKYMHCEAKVPLTVGGNARILFQEHMIICNSKSNLLDCSCEDTTLGKLVPSAADLSSACDKLLDVCVDPASFGSTPQICLPPQQASQTAAGCYANYGCGKQLKLGGEVLGVSLATEYRADCTVLNDDTSYAGCTCRIDGSQLIFRAQLSDPCTTGRDLCRTAAPAVSGTGSVTCAASRKLQTEAGACEFSTLCSQAGSAGPVNARFADWISTFCSLSGSSWRCSCSTASDNSSSFTLTAADEDAACTFATTRCSAAAYLVLGGSQIGFEFGAP